MVIIITRKATYDIPPEPFKQIVERARYGLKDSGQWDDKTLGEFLDNEEEHRGDGIDFCITCSEGTHKHEGVKKRSIAVHCGYRSGVKTRSNGSTLNVCYRYDVFLHYAMRKRWLKEFKV